MDKIIVKIKYFSIPIIIIIFFALLAVFSDSVTGQSPDAIAIRVLPNNEHLSALRWYKDKKFTGSPQSLLVDGYEAVRDGRTVYVSAANITANNLGDDVLYTNIYIISYNQEAENKTVDIFGKILAHWQFNSNMTVNLADIGQCGGPNAKNCWADGECPLGEFCDSRKARIVRDTKRLSDLADIKIGLNNYKAKNGKFPSLAAGSYLPNKSLSVWPSWQKVLAPELAITPLPVDPKNKLGACPGYNEITCWDEKTKAFADSDAANGILDLPAESHIYAYTASSSGKAYFVCAVMESGLVEGAGSGNCAAGGQIAISDQADNHQPFFTSANLDGYQGRSYEGFIAAFDPDGDNLTWTLNLNSTDYTGAGWPSAPALADLGKYQRALRAGRAGNVGSYNFHLTINDGRGGLADQDFTIKIENPPALDMAMPNMVYVASTTNPINYQYSIRHAFSTYVLTGGLLPGWNSAMAGSQFSITGAINAGQSLLTSQTYNYVLKITNFIGESGNGSFSITVVNNPPIISNVADVTAIVGYAMPAIMIFAGDPENNNITYSLSGSLPPGITGVRLGNNYEISGLPDGLTPNNIDYNLKFNAVDDYLAAASKDIKITITNRAPIINPLPSACVNEIRVNTPYPAGCQLSAADPDGHAIDGFQAVAGSLPLGLTISNSGLISGTPSAVGTFNTGISAVDRYGAVSNPIFFNIKINNYCGDNARQSPNMEGKDGPANDGKEDCDGTSNVAASPSVSSSAKQYACTGACVYTGGWCGDGVAQTGYGEKCDGTDNVYSAAPLGCKSDCQCSLQFPWDGSQCKPCLDFAFQELWSWNGVGAVLPDYNKVMHTPVVADIDKDGHQEIIFSTFPDAIYMSGWAHHDYGVLRVLDAVTRNLKFTITAYPVIAGLTPAVGDIDNDGYLEIITGKVTATVGVGLIAFEHDGTYKWSNDSIGPDRSGGPAIADINQDGVPEVIASSKILKASDGTLLYSGIGGWHLPIVADLDLSGNPEVISGCDAWHLVGGSYLPYFNNCSIYYDGGAAIGNFDNDDFPEIVVTTGVHAELRMHEHNGAFKWRILLPTTSALPDGTPFGGGPPVIADFDNDGQPEIGVASSNKYLVYEGNGSLKWSTPNTDASSAGTGSSVFDFNQDNAAEVLYADEQTFRVYDGSTGQILFAVANSSATLREYPVIADINNDNMAEIIIAANDYHLSSPAQHGIRIFGSANPDCVWSDARNIWNQHSYHITNINDNGTIPSIENNNWLWPSALNPLNNYRQNSNQ